MKRPSLKLKIRPKQKNVVKHANLFKNTNYDFKKFYQNEFKSQNRLEDAKTALTPGTNSIENTRRVTARPLLNLTCQVSGVSA